MKCLLVEGVANTLAAMLGSEDRAILDFEQAWWVLPGPKDMWIEFTLGLPASAYYERLRSLVSDPAAMEYDPLTVKRIRSLLDRDHQGEVAV